MTPKDYADKLVEEYQHIIESETSLAFAYCRTAAIKCAIKHTQAQIYLTEPGDDNDIELTESLTYLNSLL